jgi:hypothetical protein
VIDLKVVAIADAAEHRFEERLIDVLDALAARAHQVMVMLGDAGNVSGYMPGPLESGGHPGFDLRLEGAVDRREAEAGVAAVQTLVQLLRRGRLSLGGERLRDDDPLFRETPAARGDPLCEAGSRRCPCHSHRIIAVVRVFEYDSH